MTEIAIDICSAEQNRLARELNTSRNSLKQASDIEDLLETSPPRKSSHSVTPIHVQSSETPPNTKLNNAKFIVFMILVVVVEVGIIVGVTIHSQNIDIKSRDNEIGNTLNVTISRFTTSFNGLRQKLVRTCKFLSLLSRDAFVGQAVVENIVQMKTDTLPFSPFLWIPFVTNERRSEYEKLGRKFITKGFQIQELNGTSLIRAQNRSVYLPFSAILPFDGNVSLLSGYDVLSNKNLRNLVNLDPNNNFTVTFGVNLQNQNNSGVLMIGRNYVFDENSTETNEILGFCAGISDIKVILEAAFFGERKDTDVLIFDKNVSKYSNVSLLNKDEDVAYANIFSYADFEKFQHQVKYIYHVGWTNFNRTIDFVFIYHPDVISKVTPLTWITTTAVLIIMSIIVDTIAIIVYLRIQHIQEVKFNETAKKEIANTMLGYVNHELRNPLQGIMGIAEISLDEVSDLNIQDELQTKKKEGILSNLHTLVKTTHYMKHIIDDILDIRKLEEGKVDLNIQKLTISSLLLNVYKTIKPKTQEHQDIEFKVFINDECVESDLGKIVSDITLESDIYRIQQILLNFLTNSLKFTSKGYVHLKVEDDEDFVKFSVVDTGRGIPKDKMNGLFNPFIQTSSNDASRYGGIGLGLYLCKMLTNLLKGTIGCTSVLGDGSTFWFVLPKIYIPDLPPLPPRSRSFSISEHSGIKT